MCRYSLVVYAARPGVQLRPDLNSPGKYLTSCPGKLRTERRRIILAIPGIPNRVDLLPWTARKILLRKFAKLRLK
jgi:hypothetical protein